MYRNVSTCTVLYNITYFPQNNGCGFYSLSCNLSVIIAFFFSSSKLMWGEKQWRKIEIKQNMRVKNGKISVFSTALIQSCFGLELCVIMLFFCSFMCSPNYYSFLKNAIHTGLKIYINKLGSDVQISWIAYSIVYKPYLPLGWINGCEHACSQLSHNTT